MRSVACDMATQTAAPTITAATMASLRSRPLVMMISNVTAIRVIPDSGDQLVRPMHSDRITPAIHTQTVPRSAIARPRPIPMCCVERVAMTIRTTAEAPTAI